NNSNGVWMNLSGNDTGDWAGASPVYGVAVNTNDNLVYTGLDEGKFGVYNNSNGVWMNLSGNDTGDWVGTDYVYSVAVNTNNNLVYTGLTNGKFGAYNNSNGAWMNLSTSDTGDWVGIDQVYSVAVNTNNNLVYTGLDNGKFGAYNNSGTNPTTSSSSGGGGSGSGSDPDLIELLSRFNVNPKKMSVVLNQGESPGDDSGELSKTECFTVTSTGTLSVSATLNVVGEIIPFTTLTNSVLQIPVGNSKTACAIFSAGQFDIPKNYTGKIEIEGKTKKYIDVSLEIREIKNVTLGILPVGVISSGFVGILPVGLSFFPPGFEGILPVGVFIPGPIGILPIEENVPLIPPVIVKTLVKGVVVLSLWIILLLILIAYLAIKRFIKLQDQLQGYKSREEKIATIENLKRNSLREEVNFFEKIVDKGAIYLSEKALEKPSATSFSVNVKYSYNKGSEFYSKKDYDNALKEFQKSVEIDNAFWQGYQGIGSCYFAKGEIEKAKSAFEKSLSINPNNTKLIEWMKKYK
ncbi:MAG: tetratricopeptide repeat protein, partial [Nanoarchaeota archaeon]